MLGHRRIHLGVLAVTSRNGQRTLSIPDGHPPAHGESPTFNLSVAHGKLPLLDERLPQNSLILEVVEEMGEYGGVLRAGYTGMTDRWNVAKLKEGMPMRWQ